MKKSILKFIESFDGSIFVYVLCCVMLTFVHAELWYGHILHAVYSLLYALILFLCAFLLKRARVLQKLCEHYEKLIRLFAERDNLVNGLFLTQKIEDELSGVIRKFLDRGESNPDEPIHIDFGVKTGKGKYAVELKVELLEEVKTECEELKKEG